MEIAYFSDKGNTREVNQDALVIRTEKTDVGPLVMAAVCDGVGGMSRGEVASSYVAHSLSEWFEHKLPGLLSEGYSFASVKAGIEYIIRKMSREVETFADMRQCQMGTTLSLLLLVDGHCVTANVGDSRIYEINGEGITQLTRDQSFVQRQVDLGNLTFEQAQTDDRRNILLQCVGVSAGLVPEIAERDASLGTAYLICSDGFRHKLSQEEIGAGIWQAATSGGRERMNGKLAEMARLCMSRGETDNITAAVVFDASKSEDTHRAVGPDEWVLVYSSDELFTGDAELAGSV